jgi:hypothetical protein
LQDFSRFVDQKLKNGDAESLVELAGEWERQRHNGKPEIYEVEIPIEFDADILKELAGAFPEEIMNVNWTSLFRGVMASRPRSY